MTAQTIAAPALEARTGRVRWDVTLGKTTENLNFKQPPLVVGDRLFVGSAGGDRASRGFAPSALCGHELANGCRSATSAGVEPALIPPPPPLNRASREIRYRAPPGESQAGREKQAWPASISLPAQDRYRAYSAGSFLL